MKLNIKRLLVVQDDIEDDYITSVAFDPNGQILASVSRYARVQLWNVESGREIKRLKGNSESWRIAFNPTGQMLVVGTDNGLDIWNARNDQSINHLGVSSLFAVHPTQNVVAFIKESGDGGTIAVKWLESKEDITFIGQTYRVSDLAFSSDDKLAVISGDDVYIWGYLRSYKEIQNHIRTEDKVSTITFSPDGKFLAMKKGLLNVQIWSVSGSGDIELFKQLAFTKPTYNATNLTFSPDGNLLACGQILWSLKSGEKITLPDDLEVNWIDFSPDGKFLALGGQAERGQGGCAIQLYEIIF